ncbi:hypothetical protein [Bacillus sp. SD088]|uniref:hypothetical protein n=1 Tax=Bacillus sp. SD088 TaxID=2782012 RepID=UPI001A95C239|nr:hypothetical protein [Bacillus sp. SD088]MBO0995029.1 hypothetical protein [Bacillus sp. SD088]
MTLIYEIGMLIFALISISTIWLHTSSNHWVSWGVWFVFFIDFLYRFFRSESKWTFLRKNPFLIIAIIPLDNIFQLARITRLLHFMRLKVITKHFTSPFLEKLKAKRMMSVIPIGFSLVFLLVIPLYYVEPSIATYKQAFWGSISSLIFFGSSEIEPTTVWGHIIVILLTLFGILMHGVIISYLLSILTESRLVKNVIQRYKDV